MPVNQFKGMGVALVTPFRKDKSIDFDALGRLIDVQILGGIDFLVALGTTAEAATLTDDEAHAVARFVVDHTAGRVPLMIGCGGNNTAAVVRRLASSDFTGYSAILSVVPYYNKPSQEGIYRHFCEIAKASPLPIVLYNVPGRTGVNMAPETVVRIAEDCPNVVGIKEASGCVDQVSEIIKHKPADFFVLSGDDASTYQLITIGAVGVISVIGNAFPREFARMVHLALSGKYPEARDIHHRFTDLFSLLFVDGNPAGVKCALHAMNLIDNELRLPLVPTRITTDESIRKVIDSLLH